ncbi:MAG TPA: hypothetical protein VJ873_12620 [bacterium]|nr:hypothetical protein [bacterium]
MDKRWIPLVLLIVISVWEAEFIGCSENNPVRPSGGQFQINPPAPTATFTATLTPTATTTLTPTATPFLRASTPTPTPTP